MTSLGWNKLQLAVFPESYNQQQFKSRINRFLIFYYTADSVSFLAQNDSGRLFQVMVIVKKINLILHELKNVEIL